MIPQRHRPASCRIIRRAVLGALLIALLGAPAAAQPQAPPAQRATVAVWDFTLEGTSPTEGTAIANRLRSELVNSGVFRVMSRDQLRKLLGELEIGQALGDAQEAIRAGRLKGVRYVVTGTVVTLRNAVQVTAEMIDGETAEILTSITPRPFQGNLIDYLDIEVPYLAQRLAGVEQGRAEAARSSQYAQAREGKRWEFYTGAVAAGAGLVLLIRAHQVNDEAAQQAADSRANYNFALYRTAQATRNDAERYENAAFIFLAIGTALLVDYFELIPGEVNSGAHQTRTQRNRMLLVPTGRDGLLLAYQSTW